MDYLVLDIGGTWIKGTLINGEKYQESLDALAEGKAEIRRVRTTSGSPQIHQTLSDFAQDCAQGKKLQSTVISTAGVVHSAGTHITRCSEHLRFLKVPSWRDNLEKALDCPVRLINDGEAFLLGAAELGYVPREGTLCCLVIGTGLGCAISKDGRHWRPQGAMPLYGSARMAGKTYDTVVSASRLAALAGNDLVRCLTAPEFQQTREEYFAHLAEVALTANILYGADKILFGGGLCDAAAHAGVDIRAEVSKHWQGPPPPEVTHWPALEVAKEGNAMQLIGAAALARGTVAQPPKNEEAAYKGLVTEQTHPGTEKLHEASPREVMEILWKAEEKAGEDLQKSLDALSEVATHIIKQWPAGGRIIYVGAGTSGRVAVLDAVEIPCTYGYSPDRVVGVVAGGIADASLKIETEGEEDHSSVPDLILLQPGPLDTVIGISASGSAYFVRSALEYAKMRGATTVMLQVAPPPKSEWDWAISLQSGTEVVAGSTRMKAGTATKKMLNFLTTTVMAKSGKVYGPYMIDMACLNAKLQLRAQHILQTLFGLSVPEAQALLARNDFKLKQAIEDYEKQAGKTRSLAGA